MYGKDQRAGRQLPLCRQGAAVPGSRGERTKSFARYIADIAAACKTNGVAFRFGTGRNRRSDPCSTPFDHVVIATGAAYRFGLGPLATWALDSGAARWPGIAKLMSNAKLRDWFYYRGTPRQHRPASSVPCTAPRPARPSVIGDAAKAGKSKQAITSAFEAALLRNKMG